MMILRLREVNESPLNPGPTSDNLRRTEEEIGPQRGYLAYPEFLPRLTGT